MDSTRSTPEPERGHALQSLGAPAIECAPLALVEVEGPEHVVCFVNPAFCRLLHQAREDLIGRRFADIVCNGDQCVPLLDRVYETGECETHVQLDDTDQTPVYWMYAMWPALGASETPERVIIQLTKTPDSHPGLSAMNEALLVSGLRQHELREAAEQSSARLRIEIAERQAAAAALGEANAELKVAQAAAERASQAKDEFFAALSHELRTPLTPVLISAAALREDERLPADLREELAMMERNITLEARLIDDLLDLTRITHHKLQLRLAPCDAATLIRHAVEVVQPDATLKHLTIEFTLGARPGGLMGDPTRLEQAIWNLLRNAVRYTPPGGTISISTRDVPAATGTPRLQIEVSDTGVGIDPTRLERIFDAFEQGGASESRRSGGLGLGLSIVRTVVEMHGGKVVARSAGPNRGSSFLMDLPRDETSTPASIHATARGGSPRSARGAAQEAVPLRLLLVEDHAATLAAVARLLQRDGHTVATAATVADALRAAASVRFDCVISDIGLPDGNGIELIKTLRASHGLCGIALSGYGMDADLIRSHEAGFITHLTKPVAISELRRVIASIRPLANDATPPDDASDHDRRVARDPTPAEPRH